MDPDKSMMYSKRKLHQLRMAYTTTAATNVSDLPSTGSTQQTERTPKFPTEGWGTSLSKAPFFSRVEIDKHISQSGKTVGGSNHTLPTGLMKAKTYSQDEYLHNIEATYDRYFLTQHLA